MKRISPFFQLLAFFTVTICLCACSGSQKEIIPSAKFATYVNAYTGGIISQSSPIRIELTQDLPMVDLSNEVKDKPFTFSPSLKGKAFWVNNHTIEFVPDEGALKPGKLYQATFKLGDFVEVESDMKDFEFSFRVQENNFSIHVDPIDILATSPEEASIKGDISFSNSRTKEQAEKMLSVDSKGSPVVTVEATDNPSHYLFTIERIPRKDKDYTLELTANGNKADIDQKFSQEIVIPAKGSFRFLSAERIDQPENGLQLVFSDPLSDSQDLKGLVEIPQLSNYICLMTGNKVNVFFESNQVKEITLNVHEGIRNWQDQLLGESQSLSFSELNLNPQVQLTHAGVILPDSKNLILPFRAVNLYAVDLSIIRIFENNILSFLQTNSLETSGELRRSGRLVYKKTLPLNNDPAKDVHKWEDYSIDLSGIIRQEPGAIYRIVLSFKQEYSAYPCGESREMTFSAGSEMMKVTADALSENDEAEWDKPETWYSEYDGIDWANYRWSERNNPCHASYYMLSERKASCNVLASNLGMIAKQNSGNKLWITVNNIIDTAPAKGAKVTAYNFQLQIIGQADTDNDGFAEIECKGKPFIVVAEADKQKAYVKLIDGEEQSVSRFDVGGKEIQKGLKGFVYGERGVWRPGDTLHISFMLEDRAKRIPAKHPVALELYNPQGQFYTKLIRTDGLNGVYTFQVPTRQEDPTGLWNAYVKVGGVTFHKAVRIETVKPNRLKINLKLPGEVIKASSREVQATLSSSWLTGAKASRLKAEVEMSLSKANTQFKGYEQYIFNNPATEFTTSRSEVFSGNLNDEGNASFSMRLPESAQAPGMLRADITTRVFEPGGDASINTVTVPYSPYASYVGINFHQPQNKYLETDKDHVFDVVTLNTDGKPIDRNGLQYKIYRIGWSWWWENTHESFGNYINSSSITPVTTGTVSTSNGKGNFSFRVDYPGWGRYLVYIKDSESGHATGGTVYVDWPEWRGRSSKSDPSGIKMLSFSLDKESYEPGETVTAILPASAGGRALVAIENGSSVLKREWIEVSGKGDTKYQFKVTPEMAPNVYLHISLLQPHAQTVNDLPIRMYGVMPVLVTDKQTILEPVIQMPDALRPEKEFSVTVSEKSGKPMTYTLAIVDDGLLDLTNFRTPDPWSEFYAREALGIRTWDMYDNVLGAFAGSYSSLFSTGGDEALKQKDNKANRFRPVVKFIGPFTIAKGAKRTHNITLPMYVGSVRTMVIAGQDGAYGRAEKTTPVRTPLMLLSSLPRVISTQEEISLPVNVFALEGNVKQVKVSISTEGGLTAVGGNQQNITFNKAGDQLVFFKLKAGSKTGKAVVKLSADGNGQSTKETVEIDVRNPNPIVTQRVGKWIEAGESDELEYQVAGSSPDNTIRLEASRIPSVDITRRFDYLYNYEHHCTEQLTSKALPLLFVGQFKAVDEKESEKIKANVQEAIKLLYGRQLPNGGFIYWPGNATANEWITSYAGMFLVMAQEKGYAVNANVLSKWKRFQRAAAQNWRVPKRESDSWYSWQSDLQQSFRLYTLALADAPEQGAMNRMKEMQQELSLQAKWRLAAAYAITGKTKIAGELIFNAQTKVEPYSSYNYIYGSYDRDEAMILETLILMKRDKEALEQAKVVSHNLTNDGWFSTQSTAFALMAMGRLAEKFSGTLDFQWSLNGKQQPDVKSAKAVFQADIAPSPTHGKVSVKNAGKGALSVDIITRTQLLNDTLPPLANNLRIDVRYVSMSGTSVDVAQLRQGTDFRAIVTVSNISGISDYSNLALTHIIPSGWEIYNERMIQPDQADTFKGYTYQDIRDDRVLTYFDLRRGEAKTFAVRLQATYAGSFVLPAVQCEAMYDAGAQARTSAGKVTVSK